MHEYSVASEIVDVVAEKAAGRKITKINVALGAFSAVVENSLRFYLDMILEEKGMKDVRITARVVPGHCRCECGNEYDILNVSKPCPKCGGFARSLAGGRECMIESAEVEDA